MKIATVLTVMVVFASTLGFARAADRPADRLCPGAVPRIETLLATPQADAAKFAEAARGVLEAYGVCAVTSRSNADVEPGAHYSETRSAQYTVLYGRALLQLGKPDAAKAAFLDAKRICAGVAEYISPLRTTVGQPSRYRDACLDIAKAADDELGKLAKGAPAATPPPAAPAPSASP